MDGEWTLKKRLQPAAPLRHARRARRTSKPRGAPLITDEPGEWAVADDPRPCALTCTPPSAAADPSAAQPPAAALVKPKCIKPALPAPPAKTHAELLAQYVPLSAARMALDEGDWLLPEEPTAPDSSVA
jgi:hypothetical protein